MQNRKGDILKRTIPLKKIQDRRFEYVELNRDPQTDNFYTKIFEIFTSEERANKARSKVLKRMNNPNLFYGNIADTLTTRSSDYCSNYFKLDMLIPFPEEDLGHELKERKQNRNIRFLNEKFTNKEITLLMYNLILGMHHLHRLGFPVPYLSPRWIAKTTTGYAILDNPLVNLDLPKPFLLREKECYLSPEAFENYKSNHPLDQLNLEKSDTFTVGLILLECATLEDVSRFYRGGKFARAELESCLESMLVDYKDNVLFCSSVKRMLRFDPERRTSFEELVERLPDYRKVLTFFDKEEEGKMEPGEENLKEVDTPAVDIPRARVMERRLSKPGIFEEERRIARQIQPRRPDSVVRKADRLSMGRNTSRSRDRGTEKRQMRVRFPSARRANSNIRPRQRVNRIASKGILDKRHKSLSVPRKSVVVKIGNNPLSRRSFRPSPVRRVNYNPLNRTLRKKNSSIKHIQNNKRTLPSSKKRVKFSPENRVYYPPRQAPSVAPFTPHIPQPRIVVRPIKTSPTRVTVHSRPSQYASPLARRLSSSRREIPSGLKKRTKSPLDYRFKLPDVPKDTTQKENEDKGGKCMDFQKCYETQQKEPLKEDKNMSVGYPVEDPRNPFHEEYLKLKRQFDGYGHRNGSVTKAGEPLAEKDVEKLEEQGNSQFFNSGYYSTVE